MNLVKRTLTALVLIGGGYLVVEYGPRPVQFVLMQAFMLAALLEFYRLTEKKGLVPQKTLGMGLAVLVSLTFYFPGIPLEAALYAVLLVAGAYFLVAFGRFERLPLFPGSFAVTVLGTVYISFPLNFLFKIRFDLGADYVYFMSAIVFLGDTGAMFAGKAFGRNKMTPVASPNKTWEGSIGGVLVAVAGAVLARQVLMPGLPLWRAVVCGVLVNAAAQVSDPLESLFKRSVGVKDSSHALPGHGGFLDRVDSLILAAPLFYFIAKYLWK
jgi:phosphatidate cytidylyltransferase